MVRGTDAEQGQAAGQHRPGGFGEREPGAVGGRGFLVAEREHRVLNGEQRVGDDDEMPGKPIRRTVPGCGGEHVGVRGEGAEEVLGVVGVVVGVSYVANGAGEAEGGGVTGEGPGAGVGVPDPEEGVALTLDEMVRGDPGPIVPGGMKQSPAGGVAAEGGGVLGGGYGPEEYGFSEVNGGDEVYGVDVDASRGAGTIAVGVDGHAEGGRPCRVELGLAGRVAGRVAGRTDEGALGTEDPRDNLGGDGGADFAGVVQLHDGLHGLPGVLGLCGRPSLCGRLGVRERLVDEPVPVAASQNLLDQRLFSPGEGDVEEAGTGDLDPRHTLGAGDVRPEDLGDLPGWTSGGAGQLQSDVRGVVAASPGPGGRDDRPLGHRHGELARVHCTPDGAQDGTGELDGGHGTSVGEEGGG